MLSGSHHGLPTATPRQNPTYWGATGSPVNTRHSSQRTGSHARAPPRGWEVSPLCPQNASYRIPLKPSVHMFLFFCVWPHQSDFCVYSPQAHRLCFHQHATIGMARISLVLLLWSLAGCQSFLVVPSSRQPGATCEFLPIAHSELVYDSSRPDRGLHVCAQQHQHTQTE